MGLSNSDPEPSTTAAAVLSRFVQRGGEIQFMEDETPKDRIVPRAGGGYHAYGLALTVPETVRRQQEEEAKAATKMATMIPTYKRMPKSSSNVVTERRRPTVTKATLSSRTSTDTKKSGYVPILPKPTTILPFPSPSILFTPKNSPTLKDPADLTLGDLLSANDGYVPWKRREVLQRRNFQRAKSPEPEVIDLSESEEEEGEEEDGAEVSGSLAGKQVNNPPPIADVGIDTSSDSDVIEDKLGSDRSNRLVNQTGTKRRWEDELNEDEEEEAEEEEFEGTQLLQWGESTIAIPMGLEMSEVPAEDEEICGEEEEFGEDEDEIEDGEEEFGDVEELQMGDEEEELGDEELPVLPPSTMSMLADPTVGFEWEGEVENNGEEEKDVKMQLMDLESEALLME